MIVWFEVDDLFVHFDWNLHPTGIQRVALAIMRAAQARDGDRVAFCRLSRHGGNLIALDFAAVIAACADAPPQPAAPRWLRQVARFAARHPARRLRDRFFGAAAERDFAARIAPGDVMVCLGLPWKHPDYGDRIAAAKRRYGFRFAAMIYDVLPLTDPAYFSPFFIAAFTAWFERLVPACDLILVGANHSGEALRAVCRQRGLTLPPIERIAFGSGFAPTGGAIASSPGFSEPFALYVSTIGQRKNHALLLRVWRRLAERHGDAAVPSLVFIGSGGALGAVRAEIDASDLLRAKVILVTDATDAALGNAYRRCLFTLYPSFTEGWGLPVAESLAAGKFCLASNRASLPEVGGDLVDYFDPGDDDDALAKIERAIFDADYLARRTARVVAEYRAPSWDDCAAALLRALQPAAAPIGTAA